MKVISVTIEYDRPNGPDLVVIVEGAPGADAVSLPFKRSSWASVHDPEEVTQLLDRMHRLAVTLARQEFRTWSEDR